LWAGSGSALVQTGDSFVNIEVPNDDGTVTVYPIPQANIMMCPHNWEFFAQPDAMQIISHQRSEMEAAARAAAEGQ
jgi:hypothetical protein